jgi:hypothetical protein
MRRLLLPLILLTFSHAFGRHLHRHQRHAITAVRRRRLRPSRIFNFAAVKRAELNMHYRPSAL